MHGDVRWLSPTLQIARLCFVCAFSDCPWESVRKLFGSQRLGTWAMTLHELRHRRAAFRILSFTEKAREVCSCADQPSFCEALCASTYFGFKQSIRHIQADNKNPYPSSLLPASSSCCWEFIVTTGFTHSDAKTGHMTVKEIERNQNPVRLSYFIASSSKGVYYVCNCMCVYKYIHMYQCILIN